MSGGLRRDLRKWAGEMSRSAAALDEAGCTDAGSGTALVAKLMMDAESEISRLELLQIRTDEAYRAVTAERDALKARLAAIEEAAGGEDPVSLIEAAKKLPTTADGVRVVPGMTVWSPLRKPGERIVTPCVVDGFDQWHMDDRWGTPKLRVNCRLPSGGAWGADRCYSTREAAEGAGQE